MARRRRPNRLAGHTHPLHLFVTGVIVIICFLLQQNLVVRVVQVAAFALVVVLAGKRIRWGYFAIMVASITVFNLLTPVGEVLLRAGPLTITRGALEQGLLKAFAIPGLVFISLFAVSPDLRLPGRLGGLVARLFFYFEHVLEGRKRIRLRRFVESIDEVLLGVLEDEVAAPGAGATPGAAGGHRTDTLGLAFMVGMVVCCVALVVFFGTFQ